MSKIDVSIVLVSYNHEQYIRDAIESILMQDVDFEYEIVFADDASTDNTTKIIKEYDKKIKNKQYLFSKDNHGNTYNTWNALINCKGDYFIVLEGDDYWIWKEKIKTQYQFLKDNPSYIGVSDKRCEVNKKGKIITIVGCGGDRDPLKRPIMGRIATEKSDFVIFTSDNPRTEDPEKILEDILKGVTKNNYEVEVDRRKAIQKGLEKLKCNDVLLILGKGHEDYQIIGHEKHHFDDFEEVQNYLENSK